MGARDRVEATGRARAAADAHGAAHRARMQGTRRRGQGHPHGEGPGRVAGDLMRSEKREDAPETGPPSAMKATALYERVVTRKVSVHSGGRSGCAVRYFVRE